MIAKEAHAFSEIKGAVDFVTYLQAHDEFELGFATGGWKETAEIKLRAVGIEPNQFVLSTSNDFIERENIVTAAVTACQALHSTEFDSITYFGDGVWDLHTTKALGHQFIGVDAKGSEVLKSTGAGRVIRDYAQGF